MPLMKTLATQPVSRPSEAPWKAALEPNIAGRYTWRLRGPDGELIAELFGCYEADALRIAECVTACRDIERPAEGVQTILDALAEIREAAQNAGKALSPGEACGHIRWLVGEAERKYRRASRLDEQPPTNSWTQ